MNIHEYSRAARGGLVSAGAHTRGGLVAARGGLVSADAHTRGGLVAARGGLVSAGAHTRGGLVTVRGGLDSAACVQKHPDDNLAGAVTGRGNVLNRPKTFPRRRMPKTFPRRRNPKRFHVRTPWAYEQNVSRFYVRT